MPKGFLGQQQARGQVAAFGPGSQLRVRAFGTELELQLVARESLCHVGSRSVLACGVCGVCAGHTSIDSQSWPPRLVKTWGETDCRDGAIAQDYYYTYAAQHAAPLRLPGVAADFGRVGIT
jgi:hypothetical protein